MPIYNEVRFIRRSLGAVMAQDYPAGRVRVIVADGLSTDGTREIIQSFQTHNSRLSLIDNPCKIVSTGLNAALRQSDGEVIILVGGHCEVSSDYVCQCVHSLQTGDVQVVGGPIETIGETIIAETIAMAMSSPFGVGGVAFRTQKQRRSLVDTVAFGAYWRGVVDEAGLFDEELIRNQDDEFNYRVRELGGKIMLDPTIAVRYYSRGTFRSLWRQYFQYGYWKVRVLQKHPRQMCLRQFVPLAFVMSLLLSILLASLVPWGGIPLVLIGGSYVLTNLTVSLAIAARKGGKGWKHLPLLPLTFAILHLSYGLGFLVGLVKFWNRWGDKKGRVPEFKNANA